MKKGRFIELLIAGLIFGMSCYDFFWLGQDITVFRALMIILLCMDFKGVSDK